MIYETQNIKVKGIAAVSKQFSFPISIVHHYEATCLQPERSSNKLSILWKGSLGC